MMKLGALKWWLLGIVLIAMALYSISSKAPKRLPEASVTLYMRAISQKDFKTDPSFKWLHRHCQPVNPIDPENSEGGWLKSLEKMAGNQYLLKANPGVKWGTGETLSLNLIRSSLSKNLEKDEDITVASDSELTFTTLRSHLEVVKWLQESLIDHSESSPVNRPDEMKCFGKFNQIEWTDAKATLTTDPTFKSLKVASETSIAKTSPAETSPANASQAKEPKGSNIQTSLENGTPVDQIEIIYKNQDVKEKLTSFVNKELDFVGPISVSEVNPKSLLGKIRKVSRGDFFAFFAPLDSSHHAKIGEFLAKALNRGELFGLPYSGASLLANFHIIPNNFTIEDGKPITAALPEFNFASVADAKALIGQFKPPRTDLKIRYDGSDVASTFITFFKARLKASYKIELIEHVAEEQNESIGSFNKDDVILARLKYSDHFLNDLLGVLLKLYPAHIKEFKNFESMIKDKTASSGQVIQNIQSLEKFLLEKYLVIPVGDISYSYLMSEQIRGEVFEPNLEIPLFINSFRTHEGL